jgi:hypothetical protein
MVELCHFIISIRSITVVNSFLIAQVVLYQDILDGVNNNISCKIKKILYKDRRQSIKNFELFFSG